MPSTGWGSKLVGVNVPDKSVWVQRCSCWGGVPAGDDKEKTHWAHAKGTCAESPTPLVNLVGVCVKGTDQGGGRLHVDASAAVPGFSLSGFLHLGGHQKPPLGASGPSLIINMSSLGAKLQGHPIPGPSVVGWACTSATFKSAWLATCCLESGDD